MSMNTLLLAAWMLLLTVSYADAQSLFVDGTMFAGIERRSRVETSSSSSIDADSNGTVVGGVVTAARC